MEKGREAGGGFWERESSVLESEADDDILASPDQQRGPAIMEAQDREGRRSGMQVLRGRKGRDRRPHHV